MSTASTFALGNWGKLGSFLVWCFLVVVVVFLAIAASDYFTIADGKLIDSDAASSRGIVDAILAGFLGFFLLLGLLGVIYYLYKQWYTTAPPPMVGVVPTGSVAELSDVGARNYNFTSGDNINGCNSSQIRISGGNINPYACVNKGDAAALGDRYRLIGDQMRLAAGSM